MCVCRAVRVIACCVQQDWSMYVCDTRNVRVCVSRVRVCVCACAVHAYMCACNCNKIGACVCVCVCAYVCARMCVRVFLGNDHGKMLFRMCDRPILTGDARVHFKLVTHLAV